MSKSPSEIIDIMMEKDAFSSWLKIQRIEEEAGRVVLSLTVEKDMLNGFQIAHGGITYSLADSALAFASNSHGRQAVSIETSISHIHKVSLGDILTAKTEEISRNYKIGIYQVSILNQDDVLVATFKGTVYFSSKEW